MTPEALARVLHDRVWRHCGGWPNCRNTHHVFRVDFDDLATAALAALTPAPAQGQCSCEPPYHHPACPVNNQRNATPPPPEPEGELVGMIRMALDELGVPGPGYPTPVANAVDILNAALARARGEL